MSFRCALCNKIQPEKTPAMVVFLCPEDQEHLQKQMKPIFKFSKSDQPLFKKDHPQKEKGNINLCQSCYNKNPDLNKRYAQWQSN